MKYFELTLDRDTYKTAPKLINWYRVQDVRLIKWESYHKLQKRQIYNIEPSSETIFTDIVSFPFLLVSTMVKDVIEMYGDEVIFTVKHNLPGSQKSADFPLETFSSFFKEL